MHARARVLAVVGRHPPPVRAHAWPVLGAARPSGGWRQQRRGGAPTCACAWATAAAGVATLHGRGPHAHGGRLGRAPARGGAAPARWRPVLGLPCGLRVRSVGPTPWCPAYFQGYWSDPPVGGCLRVFRTTATRLICMLVFRTITFWLFRPSPWRAEAEPSLHPFGRLRRWTMTTAEPPTCH
jgi:hypothetical protein